MPGGGGRGSRRRREGAAKAKVEVAQSPRFFRVTTQSWPGSPASEKTSREGCPDRQARRGFVVVKPVMVPTRVRRPLAMTAGTRGVWAPFQVPAYV